MYQINLIKNYLEEVGSLELLTEVYTDIAQTRLEMVRAGIERNRNFVAEIANVLHIVRVTAEERGLSATAKKKVSASVVITSNQRFYYGGLDGKVIDFYTAHTAYTGFVDRYVIGSVGVEDLHDRRYPFPIEKVVFAQNLPDQSELSSLSEKLNDYQKVFVYYPRFMTVMTQQPAFVDMTGLIAGGTMNEGENYYIFEPEIGKILNFFEQQVMAILLEQTFLESELSRLGSQLVAMDTASMNARNIIHEQNLLLARARRSQMSMQVLETYAGTLRSRK